MKLILCQPATPRFQWELDVLLTNIRQFTDLEVVLLFTEKDFTVPIHFRNKWGCSVFCYDDKREDGRYIAAVRPWLLWQYFRDHPEAEQETYLYIDSDIIFREWIDEKSFDLDPNKLYGGDCDSYIGLEYILKCTNGQAIAEKMAEICGITVDQMRGVPGIGAHIVMTNPTAAFWERAYYDSNTIYHYLSKTPSNIQQWTAEMWAQLWGWVREGKEVIDHPDLDFASSTDPIADYDKFKILHNNGVTPGLSHKMFYKGAYANRSPFGQNFDWVSPDFCSIKYVEALQKCYNNGSIRGNN